ncbi:MAG: adenylosuccinate lyase [Urechidicola sp.]|jgi:adenylosuccinate lyase|tara:strand:+ start:2658 stop:4019 length:1362 start_codon:yes stop_codon:yes gene_type:complete
MDLSLLTAITPIDGRYRNKVSELADYFSEYALIKYRVLVEIEYFISLSQIPMPLLEDINKEEVFVELRKIYTDFSLEDAAKVKEIEAVTNHDVKAVEYFIKEKIQDLDLGKATEFIHFGLTSQDINNTAIPMLLKNSVEEVYIPMLSEIIEHLKQLSSTWGEIPMLAKTHGQAASPTILGKEIYVFVERLQSQLKQLKSIEYSAKFGGATGNFNAHHIAYPEINWMGFADTFVEKTLGLKRSQYTTQVEHYDNLAALFDCLKRINTILIDFSRDVWQYIAMNYFKQKIVAEEVGSSAMPHKVNPIDFENAEGNFGIANAIFEHLSIKLPISRLQRDLTDSTVLRNVGVPIAHTIISFKSLMKGMSKLMLNSAVIKADLEDNWAVVAEAIQTVLRRESYPKPYEKLKELTRKNEKMTETTIHEFINTLDVSDDVKEELLLISPHNYTGIDMMIV